MFFCIILVFRYFVSIVFCGCSTALLLYLMIIIIVFIIVFVLFNIFVSMYHHHLIIIIIMGISCIRDLIVGVRLLVIFCELIIIDFYDLSLFIFRLDCYPFLNFKYKCIFKCIYSSYIYSSH